MARGQAAEVAHVHVERAAAEDQDVHQALAHPGLDVDAGVVAAHHVGRNLHAQQIGPPAHPRPLQQHRAHRAHQVVEVLAQFPLMPRRQQHVHPREIEIDAVVVEAPGHLAHDLGDVVPHPRHGVVHIAALDVAIGPQQPLGMRRLFRNRRGHDLGAIPADVVAVHGELIERLDAAALRLLQGQGGNLDARLDPALDPLADGAHVALERGFNAALGPPDDGVDLRPRHVLQAQLRVPPLGQLLGRRRLAHEVLGIAGDVIAHHNPPPPLHRGQMLSRKLEWLHGI